MNPGHSSSQSGFTLVEALVSVVLMATVLAALATVTAQWLPNWNRGFVSVQRNQLLELGLERLVADLSAAEYVPPSGGTTHPLFVGAELSVTFVRTAIGPNKRPGLEIVRIAETADEHGSVLVRTRAPFAPVARDDRSGPPPNLGDPVVLLRAPYRVSFSYAGENRAWKSTWRNEARLPRAVRFIIRDAATEQTLSVSTATMIHVDGRATKEAEPAKSDTRPNGGEATAPVQR
jgi:general secretion pathway protein J